MSLTMRWIAIDTPTPQRLAPFWEVLLGWARVPDVDDEHQVGLWPPHGAAGPGLLLFHSPDPTPGKNRVHLDLAPTRGTVEQEVARALELGATRADIGQRGDEPWVVLADPEGNELCIVPAAPTPDAPAAGARA